MEPISELSRRERQIMDVLYRRGAASVAEVMEEMPDPPSYSAVRATLRVLEEKGQVYHVHDGPRYVYQPSLEPERARRAALHHLVSTFFDGSAEEAVVALLRLEDTKANVVEIERLRDRIREARQEGR
ncbi:MAG TPA: BlaI/MecI/CopY family transcriptional regulator [Longimicrobiales bacterium]|nr:BlaI/MecI/CopY family transcriptional regulator [Longimicrobiales bacterium]